METRLALICTICGKCHHDIADLCSFDDDSQKWVRIPARRSWRDRLGLATYKFYVNALPDLRVAYRNQGGAAVEAAAKGAEG